AAHAGGEVVQPVELLQPVGVGLVPLDEVHLREHGVDQLLLAAGQVHEDVGDVRAHDRFLAGDPDGFAVDGAECLGDVGDLVRAGYGDIAGRPVGHLV